MKQNNNNKIDMVTETEYVPEQKQWKTTKTITTMAAAMAKR